MDGFTFEVDRCHFSLSHVWSWKTGTSDFTRALTTNVESNELRCKSNLVLLTSLLFYIIPWTDQWIQTLDSKDAQLSVALLSRILNREHIGFHLSACSSNRSRLSKQQDYPFSSMRKCRQRWKSIQNINYNFDPKYHFCSEVVKTSLGSDWSSRCENSFVDK